MNDVAKLTDPEITAIDCGVKSEGGGKYFRELRAVADAATEKARERLSLLEGILAAAIRDQETCSSCYDSSGATFHTWLKRRGRCKCKCHADDNWAMAAKASLSPSRGNQKENV